MRAAFPFAIVGFDLDGTLLDTSRDLAAAVNHALAADGRAALPVAAIVPMIGGGARHMLAQAVAASGGGGEAVVAQLLPALLAYYDAHIAVATTPFPGVLAAVDALRAAGVRCAVVTNKRAAFTFKLLDALALSDRFACILGGDSLGEGRAKPAPDLILAMIERLGGGRAAFVGDSIYDVRAAHGAGIPVVAFAGGFLQQPVETLGADAVIADYAALVPTLTRLGAI